MLQPQFILFAGGDTWRLAIHQARATQWHELRHTLPSTATAESSLFADQLNELLQTVGYSGEPILIALAASRCMASTLPIDGLPNNDFKARLYRLESQLPVEIEQVIADFGPVGRVDQSDCVLAVCADRVWLSELVAALESRQIAVGSIAPAALLAAQGLHASKPPDELVILGEPDAPRDAIDLLQIRSGRPVRWVTLAPSVDAIVTQLEWQSFESQQADPIEMLGVSSELSDRLGKVNGWHLNVRSDLPSELAVIAGVDVLSARRKPLIDLRRGPLAVKDPWRLHRKAIDAALIAAAAFIFSISVSLAWRAARYTRLADRDQAAMVSLFHEAFPNWATPVNLKAVVESEHRKIVDVSQAAGGGSALSTLRSVLSHVPVGSDFSLQRMTFTPQRFDLAGSLKDYGASDELATALRGGGFTIASPQARRLPDGHWSFTLQGSLATAAGGKP